MRAAAFGFKKKKNSLLVSGKLVEFFIGRQSLQTLEAL
jgi:hypothetical protein